MADEDEGAEQTIEEKFEAWYAERQKKEQAAKDRNKEPKSFGDLMDRIAGAVVDEAERRAAERNASNDNDDEEPSRGKGATPFSRWWTGESAAS